MSNKSLCPHNEFRYELDGVGIKRMCKACSDELSSNILEGTSKDHLQYFFFGIDKNLNGSQFPGQELMVELNNRFEMKQIQRKRARELYPFLMETFCEILMEHDPYGEKDSGDPYAYEGVAAGLIYRFPECDGVDEFLHAVFCEFEYWFFPVDSSDVALNKIRNDLQVVWEDYNDPRPEVLICHICGCAGARLRTMKLGTSRLIVATCLNCNRKRLPLVGSKKGGA